MVTSRLTLYDSEAAEDWESEAWRKLPIDGDKEFSRKRARRNSWRKRFQHPRRLGPSTAEINGIGGGYQGQGTKTSSPATRAKLTFRLVPNQDGDTILKRPQTLENHLPAE